VKLQHVVVVVMEERSIVMRCNVGIVYCDIVDIHMQDHMQMFSCENHSLPLFPTYTCCILFGHVLDKCYCTSVTHFWVPMRYINSLI
jgi:hypothetical protein